jgi:antitoxin VapB
MYALYMALHITNPDVENAVRKLASLTGESVTQAIGTAASERIERIELKAPSRPIPTFDEMKAILRSYDLKPINRDLTEDEILGYGPDGIPE